MSDSRPLNPNADSYPEWADGRWYIVDQQRLQFGRDRKPPCRNRPVVSLKRRDGRMVVLPATTRANRRFFHIPAGEIFERKPPATRPDSYLSFEYETLQADLKPEGVLPHPWRLRLMAWFRKTWTGTTP